MELKLFYSKSVSVSDVVLVGRPCSSLFSNSRGGRIFPWFCYYKGVSPKVSYSNTSSKAIQSAGQEKLGAETFSYRFNGTNGTRSTPFSREMRVLDALDDEYGGVVVDPQRLPVNPSSFASVLHSSLSHWKMQGKKGVWLKLPADRSELVPIAVKVSYSNTSSKAIQSAGQEKLGAETFSYRFNGTNGTRSTPFSREMRVLDALDDEYGGVVVDPQRLPVNPSSFASVLHSSLSHWKMQGKKGVWLKLPADRSELVPIAVKEGFQYHHAERGYVMLTYWIPEGPCMLPSNASHHVGVGGFVINDKNEVLVVQEKHYAPALVGLWKIPTGFILEAEEIHTGVVREIKEETGIDTEFVEVIAFRHAHNVAFEKSDLFFVCMLRPLSTQIAVDDIEIQAAKWMPLDEFVEQPLIQGDCMFKKIIDICIARLGKRYCGLSAQQLVSKFDGKLSSLYYNVTEAQDLNCQGL